MLLIYFIITVIIATIVIAIINITTCLWCDGCGKGYSMPMLLRFMNKLIESMSAPPSVVLYDACVFVRMSTCPCVRVCVCAASKMKLQLADWWLLFDEIEKVFCWFYEFFFLFRCFAFEFFLFQERSGVKIDRSWSSFVPRFSLFAGTDLKIMFFIWFISILWTNFIQLMNHKKEFSTLAAQFLHRI